MVVIENPDVPLTLKICSKVAPNNRFIFAGKCEDKTFSFALFSESEIAILLEFSPGNKRLVTAKSYSKAKWSDEVIAKNPLRNNDMFYIQLIVFHDTFKVFVGGNFCLSFKHVIPISSIVGIRAMETMQLQRFEFDQN